MLLRSITKDEYIGAFNKYSDTLLRFLADFTPEEAKARYIMDGALWDWLVTPGTINTTRFMQLLQITRQRAIEELQTTVTSPTIERKFFSFSDNVTADEREIFFLSYFRGMNREDIGAIFNITVEEVRAIIFKVLRDLREQFG